MDKIIPAFETTLFDPSLTDTFVDIAELGIDSVLDDGLLKNIPIANLLIGIGKTAQNIHDRNLLRHTLKFIITFHENTISPAKLKKYRDKLLNNPHFAEEELGRVIILLNSNIDIKKSELLAKFYRAYVNEEINWTTFCELSDITSRLFISDLQLLYEINAGHITDTTQCPAYKADRLISLGLLNYSMKSIIQSTTRGSKTDRFIRINELGNLFCSITLN